jgi:hypothetical protein
VGLTPSGIGDYSWLMDFIPSSSDLYHTAGFALGGHLTITSVDVFTTSTSNINCGPPVTAGTPTTCTVDVATTGPSEAAGSLNWLFSPVYAVNGGSCSNIGGTTIRCSADFTPTSSGQVDLRVNFTAAPNTYQSNSTTGLQSGVLTVL